MSETELRAAPEPTGGPRGDAEAITTKERSQFQMVVRQFFKHRLAVGSLIVLILVALFAFVGPLLWTYDHTIHREIPPGVRFSWEHPFGTTRQGHDFLGQVMRGTQQSLKVGAVVALMVSGFGSVYGAIAGFYRGRVDAIMMRLVDIILVIPLLAAVLVLSSMLRGTTWWHVAVIIGAFGWTSTARVVRGVVLSLREQEFIEAARAMGASDRRIIFRHLIPNTIGVGAEQRRGVLSGHHRPERNRLRSRRGSKLCFNYRAVVYRTCLETRETRSGRCGCSASSRTPFTRHHRSPFPQIRERSLSSSVLCEKGAIRPSSGEAGWVVEWLSWASRQIGHTSCGA
jgi:peptide/nickel transport system permease protein